MTEWTSVVRSSVRATVGLLITAVAVTAALLIGTLPLPTVERPPVMTTVDTVQGTQRSLVCSGSFLELGADPNRPSVAVPVGTAAPLTVGQVDEEGELSRSEPGGTAPTLLRGEATESFAAAQRQSVSSSTLRGLAASTCTEPVNEQWLVGGATTLGVTTTLSLGNASSVPATVQITLYDDSGQIDVAQTTGVLVPPGSERTVSLNGYAPERSQLAVRVVSTGAPVAASLGVSQTVDISPYAVDTVTRQLAPATQLVIPGVTNISDDDEDSPGDVGHLDEFPVAVRVLAPGDAGGTATVRAVDDEGGSTPLGTVDLAPGSVNDLTVDQWPEEANAVIIDANVPVVAAVQGSADEEDDHDYAWFTPAPLLPAGDETAAPIVSGGRLVLTNPGGTDAEVEVADADADSDDDPTAVTVPAGAAVVVTRPPATAILTSDAPIAAGVRLASGGNIAGYPIVPIAEREGELVVYTR